PELAGAEPAGVAVAGGHRVPVLFGGRVLADARRRGVRDVVVGAEGAGEGFAPAPERPVGLDRAGGGGGPGGRLPVGGGAGGGGLHGRGAPRRRRGCPRRRR